MADAFSYTVTVSDPSGKLLKRGTIKAGAALTPEKLAQLQRATAAQMGVEPTSIVIAKAGAAPKSAASPKGISALDLSRMSEMRERENQSAAPTPKPVGKPAAQGRSFVEGYKQQAKNMTERQVDIAQRVAEVVPYLALNYIPGGIPARVAGSGIISGIEAYLKDQDPVEAAKWGAIIQGALEVLIPPVSKLAMRAGGGAMRKLEDTMANTVITKAKNMVPWFKELPESHAGIAALAQTGEGQKLLTSNFGAALKSVKDAIPEQSMTTIPFKDAMTLGFERTAGHSAVPGKVTFDEAVKLGLFPGMEPQTLAVPTRHLVDKVLGVSSKDMALATRMMSALDDTMPEVASETFKQARGYYREGMNVMNALKSAQVIDPQSGRMNVTRLFGGMRMRFGETGSPGTSIMEETRAPGASKLFSELVPPGVKTPQVLGLPRFFGTSGGHIGVAGQGEGAAQHLISEAQPRSIIYSSVPLSDGEKEMVRQLPSQFHAAGKALGVGQPTKEPEKEMTP